MFCPEVDFAAPIDWAGRHDHSNHVARYGIRHDQRSQRKQVGYFLVIVCDVGYPLIVPIVPYPATVVPVMQVAPIIPPGVQSA